MEKSLFGAFQRGRCMRASSVLAGAAARALSDSADSAGPPSLPLSVPCPELAGLTNLLSLDEEVWCFWLDDSRPDLVSRYGACDLFYVTDPLVPGNVRRCIWSIDSKDRRVCTAGPSQQCLDMPPAVPLPPTAPPPPPSPDTPPTTPPCCWGAALVAVGVAMGLKPVRSWADR